MTPATEQCAAGLHGNIQWAQNDVLRASAGVLLLRVANPGGRMWRDDPSMDRRLAGMEETHAVSPSDP
jgi:hypothetical protein